LDTKRIDTYSTKTVANVEHLYEQKDVSSPLPRIEPLLKLIEDRAAPVLKALEEETPRDDVVLRYLSLYVAVQVLRTPLGRRFMQTHLDHERATGIVHPSEGRALPRPRDPVMAAFWDIARHLEANPDTPDAPLLHSLVGAVGDLEPKLAAAWPAGGWLFLQAPKGYAYTTSDQPAAIFAHPGTTLQEASSARGTAHVVFPQSPKNLLVICLNPRECTAVDVHEGLHVDVVNDLVIFSADRYVFASTRALAERAVQRAATVRAKRNL
jgi:hypothetical protein